MGEISDVAGKSGPQSLVIGETGSLQVSVADTFASPIALGTTNPKSRDISYFAPGSTTPASFAIPTNNGELGSDSSGSVCDQLKTEQLSKSIENANAAILLFGYALI